MLNSVLKDRPAPSEFHEFEVDKAIVNDLIHAQNGTVSTALRELIMNAIDAGSKTCAITLNKQTFSVADTGKGFSDKASIARVFKRFGEPHQEGDAIFGRFRIGRGQIMGFGVVTWHSNAFKMLTNVRQHGNGFNLIEDQDDVYPGCKVSGQFYDEINEWDLRNIKDELTKLVKYAELDITLNGVSLTSAGSFEWDIDDDDLKIKWCPKRHDGIMLFSQGIFVKEIQRYRYGIDADIVTKRPLQLNMARNEISDIDPLWKKIDKHLKARSLEVAQKNQRMSEETRKSMIYQIVGRQIPLDDVYYLPLLKDCRGRYISIRTLAERTSPITVAPKSDRRADTLATRNTIFVLTHDELRLWDTVSLEQWKEDLQTLTLESRQTVWLHDKLARLTLLDFNRLNVDFDDSVTLIPPSKLSTRTAAARSAMAYASGVMSKRISKHSDINVIKRKILIGQSAVADGWTDGISYIAVNKSMTELLDNGYYGAVQVALLLLHEYCHDTQDSGSHDHDFAFFERYHDLSSTYRDEIVGHTATSLFNRYLSELTKRKASLPKEVIKNFKWPIVNDCIEITGVMKGGLSPLAKEVLEASPLQYRVNGTRFTAMSSRVDNGYGRVRLLMEKKFIEAKLDMPDEDFIRNMAASNTAANAILEKEWAVVYHKYAELHGLSVDFIKKLHRLNYYHKGLLQALCLDNTGLVSFEYMHLQSMKVLNGANFSHALPFSAHNFDYQGYTAELMAPSDAKRTEFVLKRINSVLKGINNPVEKQDFLDTFFTHDGINALALSQ